MDKLVVKGLGRLDGEYDFDIVEMLSIGEPAALTSREGHRMKVMCGLRVGEIREALQAGDSDVIVAFAAVVLTRHGKKFDDDDLWDAPIGSAMIEIGEREPEQDEEDDALPPESEPLLSEQSSEQSTSGGASSSQTSDSPESDPSPTGLHALPRSATSDQATSAA